MPPASSEVQKQLNFQKNKALEFRRIEDGGIFEYELHTGQYNLASYLKSGSGKSEKTDCIAKYVGQGPLRGFSVVSMLLHHFVFSESIGSRVRAERKGAVSGLAGEIDGKMEFLSRAQTTRERFRSLIICLALLHSVIKENGFQLTEIFQYIVKNQSI